MILAIETSTPDASLALLDPVADEVVWDDGFTSDRAHNSAIFAPLAEALETVTLEHPLNAIVVGTGPGSYSGVRVGIAVANGVSLALGVPCFGWPSLTALPTPENEADYRVIGDARRGEYFITEIRNRKVQGSAELLSAEVLAERLEGLVEPVFTLEESVVGRFPVARLLRPSARELARRAAGLGADERAELMAQPLEPIYLRAPHITQPKRKIAGA